MKRLPIGILCSAAAMSIAAPAFAASDYYLLIDGVDGESTAVIEVQSWSWGASNPRVTASQNSQSLRESPTASNGVKSPRDAASGQASGRRGVNVAAGDVNGDGRADLEAIAKLDEISGFTITLASGAATSKVCSGKHFAKVHLVARGAVYDLEDVMISSCTGGSTLALTGRMKDYHGGHVTLMK